MTSRTFIDACLEGSENPDKIDDWIERWHEGESKIGLAEFLGMSHEEYARWAIAPAILPHIIEIRRVVEKAQIELAHAIAVASGKMN